METHQYLVEEDIKLIRELRECTQESLAKDLNVATLTVLRWENREVSITHDNIEKLYNYAYKNRIEINKIKEQFYKEEYTKKNKIVLFHGAKNEIKEQLSCNHSKSNNDFGQGFYCGESMEQSVLFVNTYPNASVYIAEFNKSGLNSIEYNVDQNWMLTIAFFRGKIERYKETSIIKNLINKISNADYIIAPIADNRMFQIIDSFIEGEITDEQCKHCLAATNLGQQYVFKTDKALNQLKFLERCYVCDREKELYTKKKKEINLIGEDKVKAARIKYRGKGQYIDEILV